MSPSGMDREFAEMLGGCRVQGKKSDKVFDFVDMLMQARETGRFVLVAPDGTATLVGLFSGAEFFISRLVEGGMASLLEKAKNDEQLAKEMKEFGAEGIVKAAISLVLFGGRPDEQQQEEGEGV